MRSHWKRQPIKSAPQTSWPPQSSLIRNACLAILCRRSWMRLFIFIPTGHCRWSHPLNNSSLPFGLVERNWKLHPCGNFYCMNLRALLLASMVGAFSLAHAQLAHNYDLRDVNWTIAFDEKQDTIAGGVTNTIRPNEGATQIAFHEGKLNIQTINVNES